MPVTHAITVAEAIAYMDALEQKVKNFGNPLFEEVFAQKSFGGTISLTDIMPAPNARPNLSGLKGWLGYDQTAHSLYLALQYTNSYAEENADGILDMADTLQKPNVSTNLFGWNDLAGTTFQQKLQATPNTDDATSAINWKNMLEDFRSLCRNFPNAAESHISASTFFNDNTALPFSQWLQQGTSDGTPIQKIRYFFGWDDNLEAKGYGLRVILFPVNSDNSTTLTLANGSQVKALERGFPPL